MANSGGPEGSGPEVIKHVSSSIPGILLEISVDGPKAHQQTFPWALIGPGVWGPPRPPVGSRGNAPVGGPRGAKPAGPKTILALLGASISLLLDMFVAIFSMLFIQNLH